jgi:hypothetical protein
MPKLRWAASNLHSSINIMEDVNALSAHPGRRRIIDPFALSAVGCNAFTAR